MNCCSSWKGLEVGKMCRACSRGLPSVWDDFGLFYCAGNALMQKQLLLNTLKVVSFCMSDFGGFVGIVYSSGFPWYLVQRRLLKTGGQAFGHAAFWGHCVGVMCLVGCLPLQPLGSSGDT